MPSIWRLFRRALAKLRHVTSGCNGCAFVPKPDDERFPIPATKVKRQAYDDAKWLNAEANLAFHVAFASSTFKAHHARTGRRGNKVEKAYRTTLSIDERPLSIPISTFNTQTRSRPPLCQLCKIYHSASFTTSCSISLRVGPLRVERMRCRSVVPPRSYATPSSSRHC